MGILSRGSLCGAEFLVLSVSMGLMVIHVDDDGDGDIHMMIHHHVFSLDQGVWQVFCFFLPLFFSLFFFLLFFFFLYSVLAVLTSDFSSVFPFSYIFYLFFMKRFR